MDLSLNTIVANTYKSNSQKIRIISEHWVLQQIFCPSCGNNLNQYDNNKPVADFHCPQCTEDFELKSKNGKIQGKIAAGAFSKIIERISSAQKPHFFFLNYLKDPWNVQDFFAVPKHFFIPSIIEKRNALAKEARRAGWIGANILLSKIPQAGQIYYVQNGNEVSKKEVLTKWKKTAFLKRITKNDAKGWMLDIMNSIDEIHKDEFSLQEIYIFENVLSHIHPENKNIKAKIRQQLQILRDAGYLEFIGKGRYRLL